MLYELCTLQHAFLADNLLGLVYKIVKGTYDAIPEEYSDEMKDLVDMILNKDESKRPTVQQILLSPFLKSKMEEFISSGGNIGTNNLKVKTIKVEPELTEEQKEEEMLKELTPAERAKKRKELKSKREAEEMKKAIQKNLSNYGAAKERMYSEFYDSRGSQQMKKTYSESDSQPAHHGAAKSRFDQFKIDPNSMTDFSCNDRCEDTFALSHSHGTEISQLTAKESTASLGHRYSSHHYDDREIKASGQYKYEENKDDEDYIDDFEDATRNSEELENVLDNYKRVLSGDITLPGEKSLKKKSGGMPPISEAPSSAELDPGTMSKLRDAKEKKVLLDYFGEDLYHDIYNYLKEARMKEVDDRVIQSQMKYFVGSQNKEALSMCFKLDQIVFKEICFG